MLQNSETQLDQDEAKVWSAAVEPVETVQLAGGADDRAVAPAPALSEEHGRTLVRIFLVLVAAVLLTNLPISVRGLGLAQSMPETKTVALGDGAVIQGSGLQVFVLDSHRLRPFSSQDTFDYYQRRYRFTVQVVEDRVLEGFGRGQPIYRLVKCSGLATVYALEDGGKRPFTTAPPIDRNSPWDHVPAMGCDRLGDLPTGPPIDPTEGGR